MECPIGTIQEKGARGRQRLKFMDGIRDVTGNKTVVDVLRPVEYRRVCRFVAVYVNLDTALR